MHQVNPLLAKLLAKENLSVEHGNYKTAWFDVKNRVLGLPIWKDHGKDVYDLLVGHEVGHALYTPYEGIHSSNEEIKGCPRDYINVVEDARIERKIRETYPGLIRTFKTGYKKLFDSGLFGDDIADRVNTLKLIDKINLKAKLADLIDIDFNDEEMQLYYETMNTQTFSDVCAVVKKILAYTQEQNEKEGEDQYSPNEDDQPMESSDEDNSIDDSQSDENEESEEGEESEYSEEVSDNDEELVEKEDEESKTKIAAAEPEHNNEEEFSETDKMFRENEEKLVDMNEDGTQTLFINDYNQKERDQMVIPYAKLAESRAETIGQPENSWKELEKRYDIRTHCNKYIKEVKKAVQPAVKEFEMKKAAFQWQRASEAKTGSINVDKLHSYKYNEDIFARVTNMADAKNHGLMLLIDYSGSMYDVIGNVIQQTMHMVSFCKAVNIPFKVYAFTTTSDYTLQVRNTTMDPDHLAMVELINSDLKKKDYEEAMYNLALRAFSKGLIDYGNDHHREYIFNYRLYTSKYEEFGSTPLNQALMVSNDLIKKFIRKNAIQKFNFVTITDGDANRVHTWRSQNDPNDMPITSSWSDNKVRIKVGNKSYETSAGKELTQTLVNNIRETYNANTMGFFIADRSAEFNYRCVGAAINKNRNNDWVDHTEVKRAAGKEYRKNKCVEFNDVFGYDSYYMLKGANKDLDTSAEEFNPTTNKSIGNEFKKFSKSKKTNKVLMQKIGAAVA